MGGERGAWRCPTLFIGQYILVIFQVYHPERDQWQEVSKLPTPKSALAAVAVPSGELTRGAQDRFRYSFQN